MKLITATPSPFARKVRVALFEKNISYEEIIDIPWNLDTKTNGINTLGKIPILLLKDQEPMFDSKVINQYLDYLEPNPLLYPRSFQENISARLLETVADGICDSVVLVFLENSRNKDLRSKNWIKRQEKKIFKGVEYLSNYLKNKQFFDNRELPDGNPDFFSNQISLASYEFTIYDNQVSLGASDPVTKHEIKMKEYKSKTNKAYKKYMELKNARNNI